MAILLAASAGFAGTETALFKLSKHQRDKLRVSGGGVDSIIISLLSEQGKLLTALLFGNLLVNVLYFAISGAISISLSRDGFYLASTFQAIGSLLLLLICGEMLPKSFAYSHSIMFARITATGVYVMLRLFSPLLRLFDILITIPIIRLLAPMLPAGQKVTIDHLKLLLSETAKQTADPEAAIILNEIVELRELKVRDIMRHRTDMIVASIESSVDKAIELMVAEGVKKLPIFEQHTDNIVGFVSLRCLMTKQPQNLAAAICPVKFVPEQKKVDSLLESFRKQKFDMAIVVDEYGGISGLITIKDIINELLGASHSDIHGIVEQIGPMSYRLGGDLPIHDWLDITGISKEASNYTTIGGFITALINKVPVEGDTADYKNLHFKVEQVQQHRIKTLILEFK